MLQQRSKQNAEFRRRNCLGCLLMIVMLNGCWTAPVSGQQRIPIQCNDPRGNCRVECNVRPGDQVFLVSSRDMHGTECSAQNLKVWTACDGEWLQSDLTSLLNSEFCEAKRETILFVHGHMTNFNYAQIRGFQAYHALFKKRANVPPTRFIVWAWPSEVRGQKRYTAGKSFKKADTHAFYLARLLNCFERGTPVSLIGYSYGSRIVLDGLHLVGGGRINGQRLSDCSVCQLAPCTTTLIAPGIERDCLEPNGSCCHALKLMDRLMIIHNDCDIALKGYRLAPCTGFKKLLGQTGAINPQSIRCAGVELTQLDSKRAIGPKHALSHYIKCDSIMTRVRDHVFFNFSEPSVASVTSAASVTTVVEAVN